MSSLTDWEREELEALRKLVKVYSQRIEELEAYNFYLQRQIGIMQQEYGWKNNPDIVKPKDLAVNLEKEILNDKN